MPMKTTFCHYCIVCGNLNPFSQSIDPHAMKFYWANSFVAYFATSINAERSYDSKVKGNDVRTQTLPKGRAKQLIQGCNARGTSVLVIRLLTELGRDTLFELLNFNGNYIFQMSRLLSQSHTSHIWGFQLFITADFTFWTVPIKRSTHLTPDHQQSLLQSRYLC